MKSKFYISLKFKLTIIISILVAAISLFVFFYFPHQFEVERLETLKEKAESVAKIAAYGVASGLYIGNKKKSNEEVETLIKNEAIRYVVVWKGDSLNYQYNLFIAVLNNYNNISEKHISEKWKILKVSSPIIVNNEKVGDIFIGYSLNKVYKKIEEMKSNIAIVSTIIFIFGSVLVYLVGYFFTAPLTQMVKTVKKISAGDLTQRSPIKSNDEVGYLAKSFNEMVETIQNTNEEFEVINKELENRVQDRTVELENALKSLQKENRVKENAQREIQTSLKEKEVLLKEIHHRVKNNLQIVSSLFFFQSKNITDPVMLEMFRDGQNRVKSMALIHEKLYQSGDLANIDFKEYVKKLTTFLFQSYGVDQSKIRFKNNVRNVSLGVDQAVPCGLIINELISNSLKHGYTTKSSGVITIEMEDNNTDNLIMTVSDDGDGLPANLDIQKSDSLGLRLVNNLSIQLNGKIEFFNNNGTTVKLTFQNPRYKMAS